MSTNLSKDTSLVNFSRKSFSSSKAADRQDKQTAKCLVKHTVLRCANKVIKWIYTARLRYKTPMR